MALVEVFESGSAVVEPMPGKCPDCLGTGGVLDVDGSLTGVVGQPVACPGCVPFDACQKVSHPVGCTCSALPSGWWGE